MVAGSAAWGVDGGLGCAAAERQTQVVVGMAACRVHKHTIDVSKTAVKKRADGRMSDAGSPSSMMMYATKNHSNDVMSWGVLPLANMSHNTVLLSTCSFVEVCCGQACLHESTPWPTLVAALLPGASP